MNDVDGSSASRASGLRPEELDSLMPHVVDLKDGMLTEGLPGLRDGEFGTQRADIDALFSRHLPAFLSRQKGLGVTGPVPVAVYAHGGLVSEAAGLRNANRQVSWWLDNGVYPVHFVWETGMATALADALGGWLSGRRGLGDWKDKVLEAAARFGQGERIWHDMKDDAEAASTGAGGALYFADALGSFCHDNPGAISVHAVGHSAGSIFHSHFLPAALASGVPEIATVSLLAPAVRVDEFKRTLVPQLGTGIRSLAMFTMDKERELADTCLGLYGKSLLYLVRAALEPERNAPILGLQECVQADPDLRDLFTAPGLGGTAEVIWSATEAGPRDSSTSSTHGGFSVDRATMNSVLRRITGADAIQDFPVPRGADEGIEEPAPGADRTAPVPGWPEDSRRKALCIGINEYPLAGDRLEGCVADAEAWAAELGGTGFSTRTLLDAEATRENILLQLLQLVSSGRPGDVLAVTYSGHGSTAPDLNNDEATRDQRNVEDEALCPVDFRSGELILDDDLGTIWDLLPRDVSLTLFFDSCHSGGARRRPQPLSMDEATARAHAAGRKPRRAVLDPDTVALFRAKRGGTPAPAPFRTERELLFSACRPDELAFESNGQGDFTTRAVPLLAAAAGTMTNAAFHRRVRDSFGAEPQQHPELEGDPVLGDAVFLAPAGAAADPVQQGQPAVAADGARPQADSCTCSCCDHQGGRSKASDALPDGAGAAPGANREVRADAEARALKAAAFLRAAADLIEP